jgi:hypothetical protein
MHLASLARMELADGDSRPQRGQATAEQSGHGVCPAPGERFRHTPAGHRQGLVGDVDRDVLVGVDPTVGDLLP